MSLFTPNFVKRIEKYADNQLHAGETVISTAFLQQKGSFSRAMSRSAFGLIGSLINHLFTKGSTNNKVNTSTPLSKKLPEGTILMALTSKHRILVYKHKELGASIESFATEYHRGDIVSIDLKSRLLMTNVNFHFKDGGSVMMEAAIGQKLNDFADLTCKAK